MRQCIEQGLVTAVHDCADGGLLVSLAEMALAGGIGADIHTQDGGEKSLAAQMFGEDQGRYLVTVKDAQVERLIELAKSAGISCTRVGTTGGNTISIGDRQSVSGYHGEINLKHLRRAHESFFKDWMEV